MNNSVLSLGNFFKNLAVYKNNDATWYRYTFIIAYTEDGNPDEQIILIRQKYRDLLKKYFNESSIELQHKIETNNNAKRSAIIFTIILTLDEADHFTYQVLLSDSSALSIFLP